MHTIAASPLELMGVRFVVIPETDYQNLLHLAVGNSPQDKALFDLDKLVDAEACMTRAIGEDLRAARESAGLTQADLARKLRKSQALISAAERGTTQVGLRYVESVLKACGLPKNWKPV
jgi:DNA-binding XRE family transcriptional regulator